MSSPSICAVRSVALKVPDLARAEAFYTDVWHLDVVDRTADAIWLRGTGADHHLIALHAGSDVPQVLHVTLRARSPEALDAVAKAAADAGGTVVKARAAAGDPAGGERVVVRDADGRVFEVVHGDARHADASEVKDRPMRLAHVVLFLERDRGLILGEEPQQHEVCVAQTIILEASVPVLVVKAP